MNSTKNRNSVFPKSLLINSRINIMHKSCSPYNGIAPLNSRKSFVLDFSGSTTPANLLLNTKKNRSSVIKNQPVNAVPPTTSPPQDKNQDMGCWDKFISCLGCFSKEKIHHETLKVTNEKGLREFINERKRKKVDTILVQQEESRKTLVLDLDETLVHSSYQLGKWDFKINFMQDGEEKTAYTKIRYGLDRFLEVMSQHYELIVFTGGIPDLACKVLEHIDPNGHIKHRIYRQNCIEIEYANKIFLKNLNILNRNLQDVVLLDVLSLISQNSKNSGLLNPQNLLLINSFYQDDEDRELVKLIPFLIHLSKQTDVRVVEQHKVEYFKVKEPGLNVRTTGMRQNTVRMDVNF